MPRKWYNPANARDKRFRKALKKARKRARKTGDAQTVVWNNWCGGYYIVWALRFRGQHSSDIVTVLPPVSLATITEPPPADDSPPAESTTPPQAYDTGYREGYDNGWEAHATEPPPQVPLVCPICSTTKALDIANGTITPDSKIDQTWFPGVVAIEKDTHERYTMNPICNRCRTVGTIEFDGERIYDPQVVQCYANGFWDGQQALRTDIETIVEQHRTGSSYAWHRIPLVNAIVKALDGI